MPTKIKFADIFKHIKNMQKVIDLTEHKVIKHHIYGIGTIVHYDHDHDLFLINFKYATDGYNVRECWADDLVPYSINYNKIWNTLNG